MSRGIYRGIYSLMLDEDDYRVLPPPAKLVLLTVRLCREAGPAAIFRCYPATVRRQTGLGPGQIETAFRALETAGWLAREGDVVWIRNGLRYDPSTTLANANHRKAVEKWIADLPKLAIVLKFCDYYALPYPSRWDTQSLTQPHRDHKSPSPSPNTESDRSEEATNANGQPPTPLAPPSFQVPPVILAALGRCSALTGVERLRHPKFWQAQIRARGHVDFPHELLEAQAWIDANPTRAPKSDYLAFLNRWFKRAAERTP